ncbi:MAG: Uncharacterised protein [Flavobacteriia bacterium]|nr:MAG: Uncharacterised protein [Flavobacteriia bacterium]
MPHRVAGYKSGWLSCGRKPYEDGPASGGGIVRRHPLGGSGPPSSTACPVEDPNGTRGCPLVAFERGDHSGLCAASVRRRSARCPFVRGSHRSTAGALANSSAISCTVARAFPSAEQGHHRPCAMGCPAHRTPHAHRDFRGRVEKNMGSWNLQVHAVCGGMDGSDRSSGPALQGQ